MNRNNLFNSLLLAVAILGVANTVQKHFSHRANRILVQERAEKFSEEPKDPPYFTLEKPTEKRTIIHMEKYGWKYEVGEDISDARISVFDQNNTCLVSLAHSITCLELTSGKHLWTINAADLISEELKTLSPEEEKAKANKLSEERIKNEIEKLQREIDKKISEMANPETKIELVTQEINALYQKIAKLDEEMEKAFHIQIIPSYSLGRISDAYRITFDFFEPNINVFVDPQTGKVLFRKYQNISFSHQRAEGFVCLAQESPKNTTHKISDRGIFSRPCPQTFTYDNSGNIVYDSSNTENHELHHQLAGYGITHFNRFHDADTIRHVIESRRALAEGDKEYFADKPLYIVMVSESDPHDVALRRDTASMLRQYGNVLYFEIPDETTFLANMAAVEKLEKPCELMIHNGHGAWGTFSYGAGDPMDDGNGKKDETKEFTSQDVQEFNHHFACLEGTQILYYSCLVGHKPASYLPNIVDISRFSYGSSARQITGPIRSVDSMKIDRDKHGNWNAKFYQGGQQVGVYKR